MRPTVFLEGFFRLFAAPGDVSVVLDDPTPHIGQIYNLTGFECLAAETFLEVDPHDSEEYEDLLG
jgi:hypothetical protein